MPDDGHGESDSRSTFFLAQGEMARRFSEYDWHASALGCPGNWSESLCTLVGVMLNSSQPMFIVWGDEMITLYNDAYSEILADKHPALGKPFNKVWDEIWQTDLEPIVTRAYAGEALHMEDFPLILMRKGFPEETHFSFSYTPVRGSEGRVEGFFCPCLEITEQILEERRVTLRSRMTEQLHGLKRTSEIRGAAAELIGSHLHVQHVLYAELQPEPHRFEDPPEWSKNGDADATLRAKLHELCGAFTEDLLSEHSFSTPDAKSDQRLVERLPADFLRQVTPGAMIAVPVHRNGTVFAALVLLATEPRVWHPSDVSLVEEMAARMAEACERARLLAERSADEQRLRKTSATLALATAATELGSGTWNFTTGTITLDQLGRQIIGMGEEENTIAHWLDRTHPEDLDRIDGEVRSCLAEKRPFDLQYRVVHPNGLIRHVHGTGLFEADERNEPLFGTGFVRDVTALVEAEQHQNLLMAELDHRVKNILALVQSIAQMSFRKDEGGIVVAAASFLGRIRALAQSHALLAKGRWKGAELRDLVTIVAEPYCNDKGDRIRVEGDKVKITPKAAQTLALALHELLTNAVKHGALSTKQGVVAVTWKVVADGQERRLAFAWEESGGPSLAGPPQHRGFGSNLIEGSLSYELQGNVEMEFTPSGLSVVIDLPLEKVIAGSTLDPSTNPAAVTEPPTGAGLAGARILVVEDDHLVAQQTAETLRAAGAMIEGPVGGLEDALNLSISERFDGAVLDINLNGRFVWPAARALRARGIPFVFATGYSELFDFPDDLASIPRVEKPYDPEQLVRRLERSLTQV